MPSIVHIVRRPIMRLFYRCSTIVSNLRCEPELPKPIPNKISHHLVQLFVITFVVTFVSSLLVISVSLLVLDHYHYPELAITTNAIDHRAAPSVDDTKQKQSIRHRLTSIDNDIDWSNEILDQNGNLDIPVVKLLNPLPERWIHQPKSSMLKRNSTKFIKNQLNIELQNRFPNRLLDIDNFRYRINGSKICSGMSVPNNNPSQLNLVILIHSASDHFQHRNLIRRTWASHSMINDGVIVRHAFILGEPSVSSKEEEGNIDWIVQEQIDREQSRHGDLVQANFRDTYHNLTYKHLTSLRWVVQFCSTKVDYVLKMDDDAALNLHSVIRFLSNDKQSQPNYPQNFLACSLFVDNTRPRRVGKWALTHRQYPYPTFPRYCSGVGYFLTPDVAFDLYEGAHNVPILPISIDDVFVTGLVVASVESLHQIAINSRFVYKMDKLKRWLRLTSNSTESRQQPPSTNQLTSELIPGQCPESFLIADIGSEPDWKELAIELWNRTKSLCK